MVLRTLTFGDLDSGLWGAAWELGEGAGGFALLGDANVSAAPRAALRADWSIAGEGVALESAVGGERSRLADGFDQLATVRGRLRIAGTERSLECLGRRGEHRTFDPSAHGSIRDVSAWFEADEGLAVLAVRPAAADGHGEDLLTASAFQGGRALAIADPRLSTTYDPDGSPIRAGLELWPERDPDHEQSDGDDQLALVHPLRAAGEAVSGPATTLAGPLAVQARLFRWHARGRVGAGIYLLARVR